MLARKNDGSEYASHLETLQKDWLFGGSLRFIGLRVCGICCDRIDRLQFQLTCPRALADVHFSLASVDAPGVKSFGRCHVFSCPPSVALVGALRNRTLGPLRVWSISCRLPAHMFRLTARWAGTGPEDDREPRAGAVVLGEGPTAHAVVGWPC